MAEGHLCVKYDYTLDAEVAFGHDKSGAYRDDIRDVKCAVIFDAEVAFGHDKSGT